MADLTDTKTTCPSLERLRQGPPTVSIDTAAEYLGVSRGFAYTMAKSGHLPVIRLSGTRMRVPTTKLLRLLQGEGGVLPDDPEIE
jgi:excisionase family DNA binding protein